jgi:hypothetical protein
MRSPWQTALESQEKICKLSHFVLKIFLAFQLLPAMVQIMKTYVINSGLFLDKTTVPPTACGFIFPALGTGAFEPTSRIVIADEIRENQTREATDAEIETHNNLLARAELAAMEKHGKGILYLSRDANGSYSVAAWSGLAKTFCSVRTSWHNMAGKDGRKDVYFQMGGKRWHGVNIGNNQIVRAHVLKKQR